jgi:long-chain acyl-CoA synthetase
MSIRTRTIAALWADAVAEKRGYPAFRVERGGTWHDVSWAEAGRLVDELAAGFISLGIETGDRVAILSRTRLEWTITDFALSAIGAVVVPLYPTSSTADCLHILMNSRARALICEDSEQLERLDAHRSTLTGLEHVFVVEATAGRGSTLRELSARGRDYLGRHPAAIAEARAAVGETDVLTILYTSGTTGPPKGCVVRHADFWFVTDGVRQIELLVPGDSILLYLPLAHNVARLVQFVAARVGGTIAFCPDVSRLAEALAAVRPTILPSVPRVFEKVHAGVRAAFSEQAGARRRLVDWALGVGFRASELRQAGRGLPAGLACKRMIADRLVFAKIRKRLGGRLRLAVSGGAPLAKEIAEFFHALGVLVLEGYGLTEATSATHVNRPNRYRFGTVGPPLPSVEARIAADGEIEIRSEAVFVGYYGDEEATRAVLPGDGWLRTGDIGEIDRDGFLTITDRKKDIIVTAGGKNVAPQNIENALKAAPYISQALVVGDRRPYLVALVTVDEAEVAKSNRTSAEIRADIDQLVSGVNATLGRFEQLKRVAVLPRDFSPEEGEITPTLKLRRRVCEEHFRAEIDSLYE